MNTIKKNNYVNLAGMQTLLAILMMAIFAGFAQAETAPKKTETTPKKVQAAPKMTQPASTQAPATTQVPPFDHAKTGFLLRDVHTTLRCEQCHVDGVFKNTPKECAGCHAIGSRVAATPRPINHVQTTQPCDTCHTSPTTFLVASFKHVGVTSDCKSCHNGQSLGVVSKPTNHFPTLMPCENCHNTTTFSTARMDHTGITSGCTNCHMGQFAGVVSKPAAHISTTADCGVCHNTITFSGATFDHSAVSVAGQCNNCHLGQYSGVVSKPAVHIPTGSAQCDACHTVANTSGYTSFLGGYYDHVATASPAAANNCSTCHTGQFSSVDGKPAFHITTAAQCDTCHTQTNTSNYTTFYGATFSHAAVAVGSCGTCHNGVQALGKPATHVATTAVCDSCHTNTQSYTTWLGAVYTHNPNPPTAGSCPACHNGVTALGKPANHLVTSSSCDACHTQANTGNFTTFLGATGVDHTSIAAGTCATCHNGSQATGKTAGHIPTGVLSCDNCHQKYNGTSVLTFLPGTMNHTVVTGTGCSICHGGAYTTQGLQYGGAQAKPSNHIPTTITTGLECTTCHRAPVYTSSTGWSSEQMNHNNAQGMGSPIYCVTCHLSGTTYLGSMQKKSHNGASVAKDCSSSSCHKPLGRTGTAYSNWN
jgi:predicted CXXCH cytochrome family protein